MLLVNYTLLLYIPPNFFLINSIYYCILSVPVDFFNFVYYHFVVISKIFKNGSLPIINSFKLALFYIPNNETSKSNLTWFYTNYSFTYCHMFYFYTSYKPLIVIIFVLKTIYYKIIDTCFFFNDLSFSPALCFFLESLSLLLNKALSYFQ